ncbi:hypothetical protein EYR41_009511 [Orbilia oligospora]|uniref:Uncharacterized protein n=1 Tax=Orbilia oligospora TaxID=2813651 RepID=A0A8H2HQA5_ORBOL|nr:hypothetical protein EYR41_009511 [Orbilia oligospora]
MHEPYGSVGHGKNRPPGPYIDLEGAYLPPLFTALRLNRVSEQYPMFRFQAYRISSTLELLSFTPCYDKHLGQERFMQNTPQKTINHGYTV